MTICGQAQFNSCVFKNWNQYVKAYILRVLPYFINMKDLIITTLFKYFFNIQHKPGHSKHCDIPQQLQTLANVNVLENVRHVLTFD